MTRLSSKSEANAKCSGVILNCPRACASSTAWDRIGFRFWQRSAECNLSQKSKLVMSYYKSCFCQITQSEVVKIWLVNYYLQLNPFGSTALFISSLKTSKGRSNSEACPIMRLNEYLRLTSLGLHINYMIYVLYDSIHKSPSCGTDDWCGACRRAIFISPVNLCRSCHNAKNSRRGGWRRS